VLENSGELRQATYPKGGKHSPFQNRLSINDPERGELGSEN